jgi:hypothetical protein
MKIGNCSAVFEVVDSCLLPKNRHFFSFSFLSSPDRGCRVFAEQLIFPPRFAPQSRPLVGANATVPAFAE